jgi:hypothetical protein
MSDDPQPIQGAGASPTTGPAGLSDAHYDWVRQFCGIDPRGSQLDGPSDGSGAGGMSGATPGNPISAAPSDMSAANGPVGGDDRTPPTGPSPSSADGPTVLPVAAALSALAPAPLPDAEGPVSGVFEKAAENAGKVIVGAAEGVALGAAAVGAAVGAAILTWSTSTAPPWMDEINPETGKPYASEDEWKAVKARRAQASSQSGSVGNDPDRHTEEAYADDVIKNYNPAQKGEHDCDPIIEAIKGMIKCLRERYDAMAELGGGDAGHRQRYQQSQGRLKRLIDMAKFKECPIDTSEAEEWSTYPLP